MCGIAGFADPYGHYTNQPEYHLSLLEEMGKTQVHRGPDDTGTYLSDRAGLAHVRLSVVDLKTGQQPMVRRVGGYDYAISHNGEIYNTAELRQELSSLGWQFQTTSDTEVILLAYIQYGMEFVKRLNGIFAFAIADEKGQKTILYRDRSGVKPLFYTLQKGTLVFSSEIKGLFAYPGVQPQLDVNGLNEIFSLGPARTPGCGVFKGIHEVLPGHCLICSPYDLRQMCYWRLESRPHLQSYEDTVEHTAFLVRDAIQRQMVSDVPICTFLSGGVDSSLVSAVCAAQLAKKGEQLTTFSFDFTGNDDHFQANDFQPSRDRPYVEKMVKFLGSRHHYLECGSQEMADCLFDSVDAHDLPAMADVDSSMLYFCSLVKNHNKVVLTGECADEIFGGYPWFHKPEFFSANTFPWTRDIAPRKALLKEEFLQSLQMDDYIRRAYHSSVAQTPQLDSDSPEDARRREIAWLNLRWFMQTLLNRMDRASMYSGLEARVPFADHRIIEYLWNIPWDMKTRNGVVKHLLREAGKGLVPDEILFRRKSPYPKTYDPGYENILRRQITEVVHNPSSPILSFLDKNKLTRFLDTPSNYGKPWYGQLMAGPQMLAYLLQINYWMEKYKIQVLW